MRVLILACLALGVAVPCAAAEGIGPADEASYRVLRDDGQATVMQLRLSRQAGTWVMQGREAEGPWKDLSCERGCDYRDSTRDEARAYLAAFPASMHDRFDVACIQNTANAFCRLTMKSDASRGGHALIALVTGKPIPMSLQRLD